MDATQTINDGEIESATASAHSRLDEQRPWLERLPADFHTVLDVGAGLGAHSKWFLDAGRGPVALDRYGEAFAFGDEIELIRADVDALDGSRRFDAVFCSHVLEHFPDPASAIRKMRELIEPGGYLFVVVPPYSPVSVNYHWHIGWNCTQLALLLVALGFDCSEATFMQIGQNVCGWGRKADIPQTQFNLRRSLPFLPRPMAQRFYVKDGYEFLPGDLVLADQVVAEEAITQVHFGGLSLSEADQRELLFEPSRWNSIERVFAPALDLTSGPTEIVIAVEGAEVAFRMAVGSGVGADQWSDGAERYLSAKAGLSIHRFKPRDFRSMRGAADFSSIRHISIGGSAGAKSRLRFWCRLPSGAVL
jgi:SAM-dependent methyltransferase